MVLIKVTQGLNRYWDRLDLIQKKYTALFIYWTLLANIFQLVQYSLRVVTGKYIG